MSFGHLDRNRSILAGHWKEHAMKLLRDLRDHCMMFL